MRRAGLVPLLALLSGCIGTFAGAESTAAHTVIGRGGGSIKLGEKSRLKAYVVTNLEVSDHTSQKVRLRHLGGGIMFETGGG